MSADWLGRVRYRNGQILARMSDVTAVFAANDHLALGILRALHERAAGFRDVSVIGFDDVPEAAYYIPPLTPSAPTSTRSPPPASTCSSPRSPAATA